MCDLDSIACSIGYYYFDKACKTLPTEGAVTQATKDVSMLGITSLELSQDGGALTITLTRPGLIIGRHGEEIKALAEYLKRATDGAITKIHVLEYKGPLSCLFGFQYVLGID